MSAMAKEALLPELHQILGEQGLQTDAALFAGALTDHHGKYRGRALALALPDSTAQVAAVLRLCHRHDIGVVPQGGNTGYCGGATPDESGTQLLLGLQRLRAIRSVDAANFSMTVEAGCLLAEVQQAAADADRYFPLQLGSAGSCQIGGNLATNAGGLNVLRFGMCRDLVLGIEVVLPDGSLCNALSGLRKNNTGYDLKSLFIGSEGTLGVITAATLKLWPRQRSVATAFVALRDLDAAIELLTLLRETAGETVNSYELLPRPAIELVTQQVSGTRAPLPAEEDWYVLCELASSAVEPLDELLQQALLIASETGLVRDASIATSERQRAEFWKLRESVPAAQRQFGPSIKHDVSVPISQLPAFVREASARVTQLAPQDLLVCYGHVGDGSLHFNISHADDAANAAFLAREPELKRAIHELTMQYDGSISAEHGIGRLKVDELARYKSAQEMTLMRAIKQQLDPRGIMNPGKLFPR